VPVVRRTGGDRREVSRRGRLVEKWRPVAAKEALELEAYALRVAARAKLAPSVVGIFERGDGWVLRMRSVGRPVGGIGPGELGRALQRLHQLDPPSRLTKVPTRFERYATVCAQTAGEAGLASWARAIRARVVPWARGLDRSTTPQPLVFCHGDVKRSNLRRTSRGLCFVDFEAARLAEPTWELANTALTLEMTPEEEDSLLRAGTPMAGRSEAAARFHGYRLLGMLFFPLDVRLRRRTGRALSGRSLLTGFPLLAQRARELMALLGAPGLPRLELER
jgi:hypothetical protein